MAFQEEDVGDSTTFFTSTNVTAVQYTVSSGGAQSYSSGGIRQYCAVIRDVATANSLDVKVAGVSAGTIPVGIMQEFPAVGPGVACKVQIRGMSKARASGAVAIGDQISVTDANGRMGTAPAPGATSAYIVGVAETAATQADDIFSVRLLIGAETFVNA